MAKKLGGYAAMDKAAKIRAQLAKKGKIVGGNMSHPRRTTTGKK